MKDPLEPLAESLESGRPVPFEWIVEHASDEASFVKTWKRSRDMDAKATVIGCVELRETGELRRSVAALLDVIDVAKRPRTSAAASWAAHAEVALRAYARGGPRDAVGLSQLKQVFNAHVGWYINQKPSVQAYVDAVNVLANAGTTLRDAFRAATEQGSHRFAFAMKQLDAYAPTLAQVLGTP